MSRSKNPIIGVLNIDKPQGWTSHDVVARVRRVAHQRRVGHAGTLDPLATGVLVVCLGKATRLVEYLVAGRKAYRATVRFGVTTDTWDATGQVLEERPVSALSRANVQELLPLFSGRIQQTPPMYSALKHQGQPLHRLARRGITVERKSRRVEIYHLTMVEWCPPEIVLEVECSKGTYIRALAHDIGQALGCGAMLSSLARTAVGRFTLEDAVPLDALWQARSDGRWQQHLITLYDALGGYDRVTIDAATIEHLRHGRSVALDLPREPAFYGAFDAQGQLIAILEPAPEPELWKPAKVFV